MAGKWSISYLVIARRHNRVHHVLFEVSQVHYHPRLRIDRASNRNRNSIVVSMTIDRITFPVQSTVGLIREGRAVKTMPRRRQNDSLHRMQYPHEIASVRVIVTSWLIAE